ncbi:hypothetical protein [Microbulbifer taiwanensis]|uniref:DUF3551 domain-containing protein n=1 Tax=Microbulbifer taiwanensis TaxID=986746 RepID=A0ABW1YIR1_9GAMM|nr:hypothetical protein [Microbulbifer taiwanensis]
MRAIVSVVLVVLAGAVLADEERPKCHVYLPQQGWSVNVREQVRARYSSSDLCGAQLSGYPCYAYFESEAACTMDDDSLVDLFMRDAERDGLIVP